MNIKKSLISVALVLGFIFLAIPDSSSAATCVLQSAKWDKDRGGDGDAIGLTIVGTGCAGYQVAIAIYENDRFGDDELVGNGIATFRVDGTARSGWTITSNARDQLSESEFYIIAVAGTGAGSRIDSRQTGGNLGVLYASVVGKNDGDFKITQFNVTPNTAAANTIQKILVTFKVRAENPVNFDSFCGSVGINRGFYFRVRDSKGNVVPDTQRFHKWDRTLKDQSLDFETNIQTGADRIEWYRGEVDCPLATTKPTYVSAGVSVTIGNPPSSPGPTSTTTPSPTSGPSVFTFKLSNPLKADSLMDFIDLATRVLFNLAIPLAVILILWAGFQILSSQGDQAKIKKGRQILWGVVIGLSIIMIGRGFVTFIISILDLAGEPSTGTVTYTCNATQGCIVDPDNKGPYTSATCDNRCPASTPGQATGINGSACTSNSQCTGGLACKNSMCQRTSGNVAGEPCLAGAHCDYGFTCDTTSTGRQTVDGRSVGTCFPQTSGAGLRVGVVCTNTSQCISGLRCDGVCKRPDGNLANEGCVKDNNCDIGYCTGDAQAPGVCAVRRLGQTCTENEDCESGLRCNVICQRQNGNLTGEACNKTASRNGDSNCASGNICSTNSTSNIGACVSGSRP